MNNTRIAFKVILRFVFLYLCHNKAGISVTATKESCFFLLSLLGGIQKMNTKLTYISDSQESLGGVLFSTLHSAIPMDREGYYVLPALTFLRCQCLAKAAALGKQLEEATAILLGKEKSLGEAWPSWCWTTTQEAASWGQKVKNEELEPQNTSKRVRHFWTNHPTII